MNRTPPVKVLNELREEVGFVCPVEGCQSPFLTWHHFDPPWKTRNHHNPYGMIALCQRHHNQADVGAFTIDQLKRMKLSPENGRKIASERFNWMRNRIILMVGNCAYENVEVILEFKGDKIIWLERDSDNNILVNFKMLSTSGEPRAEMINNQWYAAGNEKSIVCPPSGKKLKVTYRNSDSLEIQFEEISDFESFKKKFPDSKIPLDQINFPVTISSLSFNVGGTDIKLSKRSTNISGLNIQSGHFKDLKVGISIG